MNTQHIKVMSKLNDSASLQDFLGLPRILFTFSGNHVSACFGIILFSILSQKIQLLI